MTESAATRRSTGFGLPVGARGVSLLIAAAIGAFALSVRVFWIGFLGSDDTLYWQGAGGWLKQVPYLGTNHWSLRHTLVIPMALARAVLGDGLPALLLPSLLYSVGVTAIIAVWTARSAGLLAAAAALALIVTCPQFVLLSSTANVDVPEAFFILLGITLLHAATAPAGSGRRRAWLATLAGVALGLAMLSRETSAFAVVAIGLLGLAGFGMPRRDYLLTAAGFAAVTGLEFASIWWLSGDPFYRASIALHHDATTNRWVNQGAGVPLLHPLIDPVTMVLFNHMFGVLTWIGVPLSIWLTRRAALTGSMRRTAVLALTLAAVWTVIAAGMWTQLSLIPRYYLLPTLLLSVVSGMALSLLWGNGHRRLAGGLGIVLIGANLVSMWIDNRNYMYGEYMLVEIAARRTGPIHTDPQTLRRAELLLRWDGTADRVTPAPPGPGDLFYFNPARDHRRPGSDWVVMERHGLPPSIGQWLASEVLPAGMLSPSMYEKLGRGHPDVVLYAVP